MLTIVVFIFYTLVLICKSQNGLLTPKRMCLNTYLIFWVFIYIIYYMPNTITFKMYTWSILNYNYLYSYAWNLAKKPSSIKVKTEFSDFGGGIRTR